MIRKYKQLLSTLTSIAAGVTISLNVLYYNIQIDHILGKVIAVIIMDLLTYAAIYSLISLLYRNVLWKRLNKSLFIDGEWYHVHIIDGADDYIRIGTVSIRQQLYEVKMKGRNYNIRYDREEDSISMIEEQCTNWKEECTLDDSGRVVGIYTADRTFGNFSKRQGIHIFELNLSSGYPKRVSGSFFDTSPYNRIGVIELFKDKAQRDAFVKARCQGKIREGCRAFTSRVQD